MDNIATMPPVEAKYNFEIIEQAIKHGSSGNIEQALRLPVIKALADMKGDPTVLGTYTRYLDELSRSNKAIKKRDIEAAITALTKPIQAEEHESSSGGSSMADELVALVKGECELFTDTDDEPYACFLQDGHRELWPLKSAVMRDWVSQRAYRATGRTPRSVVLADALSTLAGIARHDSNTHTVYLRSAEDGNGGYYVDMGDQRWRCIHITTAGWQVLDDSPVRFRRTKTTRAIPIPTSGGTVDNLLRLVNVDKRDTLLLVTALIDSLRPDTAYPIIELIGDQGSGKSTTAENMRRLIDPSSVNLRSAPRSNEDLFVSAHNNHVVCLNNLSRLTPEMQDVLCTLSTGGGYAARRLYTNNDELIFETKRPVILNGINPTATQADLTSRTVRLECPALDSSQRRDDAELAAVFNRDAPLALGFLLDTMCAALTLLPSITLADPPRLMDYAKLGNAVGQVLNGERGRQLFTERYTEAREASALQALEAMPVIVSLIQYLEKYSPYTGNYAELLRDVEDKIGKTADAGWPKSGKGLSDAIRRARPTLSLLGWQVTDAGKTNTGRAITIRKKACPSIKSLSQNTVTNVTTVTDQPAGDDGDSKYGQSFYRTKPKPDSISNTCKPAKLAGRGGVL